jgi:hypothetical protein
MDDIHSSTTLSWTESTDVHQQHGTVKPACSHMESYFPFYIFANSFTQMGLVGFITGVL